MIQQMYVVSASQKKKNTGEMMCVDEWRNIAGTQRQIVQHVVVLANVHGAVGCVWPITKAHARGPGR